MSPSPFRRLAISLLVGLAVGGPFSVALAQEITLTAPATAVVGEEIPISWSGGGTERDFISVDPVGAPDKTYTNPYVYRGTDTSTRLAVPDEPGSYLMRYHDGGAGYAVRASSPITVTDVSVTVTAPTEAAAGSKIEVAWQGLGRDRDFLSIDPVEAPDKTYSSGFVYASEGSPVEMRVPTEPGRYEVRYHLARTYRVVGKAPLAVAGITAVLSGPQTVEIGAEVTFTVDGPFVDGDFVSIDEAGASDREHGRYEYVGESRTFTMPAPDTPGDYEIRYHQAATYKVIGAAPLKVGGADATVTPPAEIVAGEIFEVAWTGPDAYADFITIVPAGTEEGVYRRYAYTKFGSPAKIHAPDEPGDYEIRYATGQSYGTLARAAVKVVPGRAPGKLRVTGAAEAGGAAGGAGAVELILDASGSMLQRLGGERRIDLAKSALVELTEDVLPAGAPFALRVFGHRQADACRTDLEIPLGPLDRGAAVSRIRSIEAKNLAKTPIADSLTQVASDLAAAEGPRLVVLVTDGEETCDGDPEAAIRGLRDQGIDVRVNVVGFAIDQVALKDEFESWARVGGGGYFDAADGGELTRAIRESLRVPYEVVKGDEVVATGTVGGAAVEVPAGTYRVRVLSEPVRDLGEVTVTGGDETTLDAGN